RTRIAATAAQGGQPDEAALHSAAVLGDALLEPADLDTIDLVADMIGDLGLFAAALEKRASLAGAPADAVDALDRLGTLQKERQGDAAIALETWKRAGKMALDANELELAAKLFERVRQSTPDDAEATELLAAIFETQEKHAALPPLYAVLAETAATDQARAQVLLRLADVLADKLGDPSGSADAAARAFALDPQGADALTTFERHATTAGATATFARAVDRELAALEPSSAFATDLRLAKARVFCKNSARHDDAAAVYRELLEDPTVDPTRRTAAAKAFEKLLEVAEATDARKEDRRWVLAWRASRAQTDEEKALALLACARAEESLLNDSERALATYKRVLELDQENTEASAALARLTLATGDVGGAIAALLGQRDRADGATKRALDLEISTILIERGDRLDEAFQTLSGLLDEAPDDADAVTLMARLAHTPGENVRAVGALEKARGRVKDVDARINILTTLIAEEAAAADAPEQRQAWFEELIGLQRGQEKAEAALLTTLRALDELPAALALWDAAEELARELKTPGGVADEYFRVIGKKLTPLLTPEEAMELGQRAVAFHEEWFDDAERVVGVLERILTIDPTADWAFDRLKLLF
ncbi:MAG: hypothetical protein ABI551_05580, partial [Polyangiaceae bacterium]